MQIELNKEEIKLQDEFAKFALSGYLAGEYGSIPYEERAKHCYGYARAMILERRKRLGL